jgi:solute carrier family 35 protein F3/4
MSYLVHGAYSVFFVLWVILQAVKKLMFLRYRRLAAAGSKPLALEGEDSNNAKRAFGGSHNDLNKVDVTRELEDWWQQLKANWAIGLFYAVLLFMVAYTWYLSLSRTYVSVNTAIYNSACVFVFLFSVGLLKEKVSLLKIIAVMSCSTGVVLLCVDGLSNESQSEGKNETLGYVFVILSTILYSLYEVLFKRWGSYKMDQPEVSIIQEDELIIHEDYETGQQAGLSHLWKHFKVVEHTILFLGLVGVWTLILGCPGIIIVDLIDIEPFALPHGRALQGILITMALDSFCNALIILGIMLSSPLFISVGSLLTIPTSVLCDWVIDGTVLPILSYVGMLTIIAGFLMLAFSELIHFKMGKQKEGQDSQCAHVVPSWY